MKKREQGNGPKPQPIFAQGGPLFRCDTFEISPRPPHEHGGLPLAQSAPGELPGTAILSCHAVSALHMRQSTPIDFDGTKAAGYSVDAEGVMSRRQKTKMLHAGTIVAVFVVGCGLAFAIPAISGGPAYPLASTHGHDHAQADRVIQLFEQGKSVFRYDTFGDQAFWGGQLHLEQAIEGAKNGGVGPGVSPATALSVGLKVDADSLPASLKQAIKHGKVDLNDPATTLALLKLNSVVGVRGEFSGSGQLTSVGITCALCHSTVDDSFTTGIGKRLDGWPNQDLNVGEIISLAPNLKPFEEELQVDRATVVKVLQSWGPGKFNAELNLDGKAFRPDNKPFATRIPAAYGHLGENFHTWTAGFGDITYWNAYVAVLEMHGQGNFNDSRFADPTRYPVAARTGQFKVRNSPDLVTPALAALQYYQLSLAPPSPPPGSFNSTEAEAGQYVFNHQGGCAGCHMPPLFTDAGYNVHQPSEICIDSFQADRGPDQAYVTPQLKGLWSRSKLGFYHDGRYSTLLSVVEHYNQCMHLSLDTTQEQDLVEYLKSL